MDYYVNEDAVALSRCNIVKDLGIAFDAKLKLSKHLDCVTKKTYKAIFMVFRDIQRSNASLLLGWPESSGGFDWSISHDHNLLRGRQMQSK